MVPGAPRRVTQSSIRAVAAAYSRRSSLLAGPGHHLDAGDDGGAVVQVVEHQQGIGHHHHRVGQVAVIGRRVGQGLDGAHHVVAQVAHRAAGEARQPGHVHRRVPAHEAPEMLERREVGRDRVPPFARGPALAGASAVAEHLAGLGGEKGVAGPALAALERLQQESAAVPGAAWQRRTPACPRRARPGGSPAPSPALPRAGGERLEAHGRLGRRDEVGARAPAAAARRLSGGRPGRGQQRQHCPFRPRTWPTASARS